MLACCMVQKSKQRTLSSMKLLLWFVYLSVQPCTCCIKSLKFSVGHIDVLSTCTRHSHVRAADEINGFLKFRLVKHRRSILLCCFSCSASVVCLRTINCLILPVIHSHGSTAPWVLCLLLIKREKEREWAMEEVQGLANVVDEPACFFSSD